MQVIPPEDAGSGSWHNEVLIDFGALAPQVINANGDVAVPGLGTCLVENIAGGAIDIATTGGGLYVAAGASPGPSLYLPSVPTLYPGWDATTSIIRLLFGFTEFPHVVNASNLFAGLSTAVFQNYLMGGLFNTSKSPIGYVKGDITGATSNCYAPNLGGTEDTMVLEGIGPGVFHYAWLARSAWPPATGDYPATYPGVLSYPRIGDGSRVWGISGGGGIEMVPRPVLRQDVAGAHLDLRYLAIQSWR